MTLHINHTNIPKPYYCAPIMLTYNALLCTSHAKTRASLLLH